MDKNTEFDENNNLLKNHLMKLYFANKWKYRDDEDKRIEATMEEVVSMINLMVKTIYNTYKTKDE